MEARKIITLTPIQSNEVITFEDAFGEFSEVRGKRRAKRKAKKQARKNKRTAKKTARKTKRVNRRKKAVGLGKKGVSSIRSARKKRLEAKKQRKSTRRSARLEKRNEKQDSRLARRRQRAEERAYRREISKPEEEEFEEPYLEEEFDNGSEYNDEPIYDDSYEDDYYDEEDDYGYEDDYPEDSYEDDDYDDYDDSYEDDDYDDYSDDDYADEDYDDYDDEDWGYFDATVMGVDGSISVNPRVQKITDKIEFNKELLSRIIAKHKAKPSKELQTKGKAVTNRIKWLEGKLESFVDNSKSDEKRSFRRKHVGMALGHSKAKRSNIGKKPKHTIVDGGIESNISKNRIEIPAENSSNATGLNGIDLQDDYDAPKSRVVELTSNAEGEIATITKGGRIAIALLVGIGLGYAFMELKKAK